MMRVLRVILLLGLAVLVVGAAIFFLTRKEVTLIVDGETRDLVTRANSVRGLLVQEGILISPGDVLDPGLDEPLSNGMNIQLETIRPVVIWSNGEAYHLATTEKNPARLIADAELQLNDGDKLLVDSREFPPGQDLPLAPAYTLQILRAHELQVEDDGQVQTIQTTASTVGQALWEAGIQLHEADKIDLPLATAMTGPLRVRIDRAVPITIQQAGLAYDGFTTAQTVGSALAEAGFSLQGLDYSRPAESAALPQNGRIDLVRVMETTVIDQELLPFDSELGPDPEMPIDTRGISKPGAYGVDATRTRVRYEDGDEIWRQLEDQWVALEPQPQVLGYGTKIEINTINTPQGDLEYWRAVPMYATSYSPCRIFSDRCDSVTSSGATLRHGVAAVTLRHYRSMAGSQVYIPGYGIATILDVGGGIPGRNWIDLGYSDDDYLSWHDWVTVYFLTPVPPEGLILYDLN